MKILMSETLGSLALNLRTVAWVMRILGETDTLGLGSSLDRSYCLSLGLSTSLAFPKQTFNLQLFHSFSSTPSTLLLPLPGWAVLHEVFSELRHLWKTSAFGFKQSFPISSSKFPKERNEKCLLICLSFFS